MKKPLAMIIEDDRDSVAMLRHLLDFTGYKTEIVLRGDHAIERLKTSVPDIILLDLNLPGASGMEIINFIKDDERLKDLPIVVITGRPEMTLGLNTQTDLVLLKPVNIDLLTNLILRLRPVDPDLTPGQPRDELTKLYSQDFFFNRIEYSIERTQQVKGSIFGILFLDIDGHSEFKRKKGSTFSDLLLTETADYLKSSIRAIDTISRFDKDHFFIQVEDLTKKDTLIKIAQRIQKDYSQYLSSKLGPDLSISIGIVYCTEEYLSPKDIIIDAEIALHLAKEAETGLMVFNSIQHVDYRSPQKYAAIQRIVLSP